MSEIKIHASLVAELRNKTGLPMGQCKAALVESQGEISLAVEILRKKGLASIDKKADRETGAGLISFLHNGEYLVLIRLGCETDFVANNADFKTAIQDLCVLALDKKPATIEEMQTIAKETLLPGLIQKLGENMRISSFELIKKQAGHSYGVYNHANLGTKVAFVELDKAVGEELLKQIGMHIVANNPNYLSESDVPQEVIAKEREIGAAQVQGKPAAVMEKIVEGKLQKFYSEVVLNKQPFVMDTSISVEKALTQSAPGAKIVRYLNWQVGK